MILAFFGAGWILGGLLSALYVSGPYHPIRYLDGVMCVVGDDHMGSAVSKILIPGGALIGKSSRFSYSGT